LQHSQKKIYGKSIRDKMTDPSNESKGLINNLTDAEKAGAGAGVLMVVALVGAGIWWWNKEDVPLSKRTDPVKAAEDEGGNAAEDEAHCGGISKICPC
jgi:hypothetical protein